MYKYSRYQFFGFESSFAELEYWVDYFIPK